MCMHYKSSENAVGKGEIAPFSTVFSTCNPLPDDKILDRSKLKQSADHNFKFHENSRKFSKQVEKTVGKGEIARYEQFLLFPQGFQKAVSRGRQKVTLCGNGLREPSAIFIKFETVIGKLFQLGKV